MQTKTTTNKTRDMIYIGLFAGLMAVCSWLSVPAAVPFTMQTFGVFLAAGVLGGKRGTWAILVYLLLGAVGIPVFQGFTGGPGILFGNTGGYLLGFIGTALTMWGIERLLGGKTWALVLAMLLGLAVCYAFGTVWFLAVYTQSVEAVSFATVLGWCVGPFVIPDLIKIGLALALCKRLKKVVDR